MKHQIELRLPFMDKKLVEHALKIPGKEKLKDGVEKYVLRQITLKLGMPKEYAMRKKKAAQYGSNFHKALNKLAKRNGFKLKSDYLRRFLPEHNYKLAALISTGKDSIYAMHTMMKQKYLVNCMVTIDSTNQDSYMFHTPTIDLAKMQAQAIGIPIIIQKTAGEKEEELSDLKIALLNVKEKYGVQGVITGALFSNYQRERIEKICDSLSLKIFSPLWHINQETEMREIVREGYKFIMTKVAAEGLDHTWLGKEVKPEMIDKLAALKEKIGLNVAGEGGEFETLVLDGPMFNKKIELDYKIKKDSDGISATLIVNNAVLKEKK